MLLQGATHVTLYTLLPTIPLQVEGQTYISVPILRQIQRAKDQNKMTCQLMTSIFSLEDMASSLVTGKRLKAVDKERPVLDQEKVNFIIGNIFSLKKVFFIILTVAHILIMK